MANRYDDKVSYITNAMTGEIHGRVVSSPTCSHLHVGEIGCWIAHYNRLFKNVSQITVGEMITLKRDSLN